MSVIFPDKVAIVPVSRDATFNVPTEDTPAVISEACVEEDSTLRYTDDGAPIEPRVKILLPSDVVIQKGDYVTITELHGDEPSGHDAQQRQVKLASKIGGSRRTHIEVLV